MLEFVVDGQQLRRTDRNRVVAGSVDFVTFTLRFSEQWEGFTKTVLFHTMGEEERFCVFGVEEGIGYAVPHEVLLPGSRMEITVVGSCGEQRVSTVNPLQIYVESAGLGEDFRESAIPTPTLYDQICEKLNRALRELPGKRLMLKAEGESLWWKAQEESEWKHLVALSRLKGRDGAAWSMGDVLPTPEQGQNGDFFFLRELCQVYTKSGGAWEKCFDPLEWLSFRDHEVQRLQESLRALESKVAVLEEHHAGVDLTFHFAYVNGSGIPDFSLMINGVEEFCVNSAHPETRSFQKSFTGVKEAILVDRGVSGLEIGTSPTAFPEIDWSAHGGSNKDLLSCFGTEVGELYLRYNHDF